MSLYGPTFQATPIDIEAIFKYLFPTFLLGLCHNYFLIKMYLFNLWPILIKKYLQHFSLRHFNLCLLVAEKINISKLFINIFNFNFSHVIYIMNFANNFVFVA